MKYPLQKLALSLLFAMSFKCALAHDLRRPKKAIPLLQDEIAEIWEVGKPYVFIGQEVSDIMAILQKVAALVQPEDVLPAFKRLDERLQEGCRTILREHLLAVLDESEAIAERNHAKIACDDHLKNLDSDLSAYRAMVNADQLTIVAKNPNFYRSPRPHSPEAYIMRPGAKKEEFKDHGLTVNDTQIAVAPVLMCNEISLQPSFPEHAPSFVWKENAVDGGQEKVRISPSTTINEKGLFISVDGGLTHNLEVNASGDIALSNNLLLADTTAAGGVISKNGTRFIHNYGTANSFFGEESGNLTMSGMANTGVGVSSLTANSSGSHNVAVGAFSLASNRSGSDNTALGRFALQNTKMGSDNIGIGFNAGSAYANKESNNITIGSHLPGLSGESNTTRIGVEGTQTAAYVAGIRNILGTGNPVAVGANGQLTDSTVSSLRYLDNIQPLDINPNKLLELEPSTFTWKNDSQKMLNVGLIAEQVLEQIPELVTYNDHGQVNGVRYQWLVMLLIELAKQQQNEINQLKAIVML